MATRLKTIEYAVPVLASLPDNTLTAMTTITAYIPEFSGTVTFKSVRVEASVKELANMTTGNYSSRRIDVSVGGATATSYTNANLVTGSGENQQLFFYADATNHFVTNWTSGTSKTVAIWVLVDFTATTIAAGDVTVTLYITYEYDDTQTTQIKTVYLPLNAPVGTIASSKPGSPNDTIPALDTELPESSKTIRSMFIIAQGNINQTASATDSTVSMQIDTYTEMTSSTIEMGATSDYWCKFLYLLKYYDSGGSEAGIGMNTSTSHGFYIWGSISRFNHPQCYLVVTYEFNASASTGCYNSVLLPVNGVMMGGTTSTDFQRLSADLWIEEPATITSKRIAFFAFWEQAAAVGGLNMRVGTGSFVTYTDGAAVLCGSNGAMVRNDGAFTLARGKNTVTFDVYRTDSSDFGLSLTGYFMLTYASAKPTGGYGAANHTVKWRTSLNFATAAATNEKSTALAVTIPETNYFLNSMGAEVRQFPNSTGTFQGGLLLMEKTNSSGQWATVLSLIGHTDAEQGLHLHYGNVNDYVYRWANDPDSDRLDPEATRRWWWSYGAGATGFFGVDIWLTYHTNTFTISGTVSGYSGDGSGITVEIHRTDTDEKVASTTTSAGGTYSAVWYDNTINVYAQARQDATRTGRSDDGTGS